MYNRPKLLNIKIKHMKKIIILLLALGLTSCGAYNSMAFEDVGICRYDSECKVTSIHDHAYYVNR
jgi:hypothetical protein